MKSNHIVPPYRIPFSSALKYLMFSKAAPPMSLHRTFPGNIGDGISRDAAANNPKKTTRIIAPFILTTFLGCLVWFFHLSLTRLSSIVIFNKPCRTAVEQQYRAAFNILEKTEQLHKKVHEILQKRTQNEHRNQPDSPKFSVR